MDESRARGRGGVVHCSDELFQWWVARLEEDRPIRLTDLSASRQALLTAWYALASAEAPSLSERLPVEFCKAIAEISVAPVSRTRRFRRQRIATVRNNNRRIVRARVAVNGGLA